MKEHEMIIAGALVFAGLVFAGMKVGELAGTLHNVDRASTGIANLFGGRSNA